MPSKSSSRKKLSPKQQRDLDVQIGFLEGVTRRDPEYLEALQTLGDLYTRRGKFDEGLTVDEQLSRLRPADPVVYYNLACSYSLTRRLDQAAGALCKALELGFRDFKALTKDPDLANLRKDALYAPILARIQRLQRQLG